MRGHGTWDTDRPPVLGVIGRASGLVQLWVAESVNRETLQWFVTSLTRPDVVLYTDAWRGYAWVAGSGRGHATVCHTPGQRAWARDDDGDGVREVHNNTCEGFWAGLRTFSRKRLDSNTFLRSGAIPTPFTKSGLRSGWSRP